MKYFLIAGEPSGDLHASRLMQELKNFDKDAEFVFFGGDLMLQQGGTLLKHHKDMAFMGLWEVLKNLKTIKKNLDFCKSSILDFKPDVVILVDYPGFNLKIAEFAHNHGFKVFYYISPKIWAWKKGRIKLIKKYIDKMFVIFPFETEFYEKYNYKVEYLGNPTLDIVKKELLQQLDTQEFKQKNNLPQDKRIIALLPGSRYQEVEKILPDMCEVAKKFSSEHFVVAAVNSLPPNLYSVIEQMPNVSLIFDKTYKILRISDAAIVTSGTATLETALFNVPQVVCYKTSKLSYIVGKNIVSIKYFSLVNILLEREAVKELLQKNLVEEISAELEKILNNKAHRQQILADYKTLEKLLGNEGSPKRTAEQIVNILRNKT